MRVTIQVIIQCAKRVKRCAVEERKRSSMRISTNYCNYFNQHLNGRIKCFTTDADNPTYRCEAPNILEYKRTRSAIKKLLYNA